MTVKRQSPVVSVSVSQYFTRMESAAEALAYSNERVFPHTDSVLVVNADGRAGFASCVLLEVSGRAVAVTCEHVLKAGATYFIGPHRLETDRVRDDVGAPVSAARLLARNKTADVALFEIPGDAPIQRGKQPYPLARSLPITEELVAANLGTAGFICGLFGTGSSGHQYPDGVVYTNTPFYSAVGPVKSCTRDQIVVDCAEKDLLFKNDAAFPQLRDIVPTGGMRELKGISGSGLWFRGGDRIELGGIVLGRKDGDDRQEHLIRVTPVWVLREWTDVELGPRGS